MIINYAGGGGEPKLQSKTVTPGTSEINVIPDGGYNGLSSVTVSGDSDLIASNIKSGVSIFGVSGSYAATLQSKTVAPSSSSQTVSPSTGYTGLSSVTVSGDSDLIASNIKSGVSIFGVSGSY